MEPTSSPSSSPSSSSSSTDSRSSIKISNSATMKKQEQENEQAKKQAPTPPPRTAELPSSSLSPSPSSPSYDEVANDDVSFHHHHQQQQQHHHHLRAALALNNIGVSLLCKGSLSSAMKTFKDALQVMKSSLANESGNDGDEEVKEEEDNDDSTDNVGKKSAPSSFLERQSHTAVQEKLQQASIRLATKCIPKKESSSKKKKSSSRKSSSRSSNNNYSNNDFCMVEICALDDTDLAAMRSAVRYGPTVSMAFAIRCSTITEQQKIVNLDDDSISQYYTAMIRYNHGLAHLLSYAPTSAMAWSSSSSASSSSHKLLASAFKHLSQAQCLLLQNIKHVIPNILTATTTTDDDQSPQEHQEQQQEQESTSSSSQQPDTNNNENKNNNRRRRRVNDHEDDADDQQDRFVTSLLLLGLVFMGIHTYYRHKDRPHQAQQVLESLTRLENVIQEQQDHTNAGSMSSLSFALSNHLTRGASAA